MLHLQVSSHQNSARIQCWFGINHAWTYKYGFYMLMGLLSQPLSSGEPRATYTQVIAFRFLMSFKVQI